MPLLLLHVDSQCVVAALSLAVHFLQVVTISRIQNPPCLHPFEIMGLTSPIQN